MRKSLLTSMLGVLFASALPFASVSAQHIVSPNVPQDSYVYDYIDKLDALGYLPEARQTSKSYNRLQVAKWIVTIEEAVAQKGAKSPFVIAMLNQLREDFATELEILSTGEVPHEFNVTQAKVGIDVTKGKTISQNRTKSSYQPFAVNNSGYDYADGVNGNASFEVSGYLGNKFAAEITPRFDIDKDDAELSLARGYVKTYLGSMEIQIGKDDMWWGPNQRGVLGMTTNAKAQTGIKLSSIDPIEIGGTFKFLGKVKPTFFLSKLSDNRTDVKEPNLFGGRIEIMPNKRLVLGASMLSIVGGEGNHLSSSDWGNWLVGKNDDSNDKWNSLAGYDVIYKMPKVQIYGSIYGEDQSTGLGFIPSPSKIAWNAGLYLPTLSTDGRWDLRIEGGKTNNWWYNHWVFTDGFTHKGHIMGDYMGHDSRRLYARLGYFDDKANQIGLNVEYLEMNKNSLEKPEVLAVWLDARHRLQEDLLLEGRLGVASIDRSKSGDTTDYIVGVNVTKTF
ncbi:capsule assembly Wzi family protein [Veillonella criceti]|uniref:Capsule assembly protein Wzi n=1 Tax=Veillonella criceti TaxID=103891 RepID=A0A380NN75_9FIRM|nr:capsule assembly Wzi family protein [Veillonella criceti]SUP44776.1 Uncharacterised protein [Veillonella criceti]